MRMPPGWRIKLVSDMALIAKIGERAYTFRDSKALASARNLYAHSTGDQNDFEALMTQKGVLFSLASEVWE